MAVQLEANWSELTDAELTQLKEELRISRELRQGHGSQRLPYLPSFSGDSGITFSHYQSAIQSIESTNSDQAVVQAIRKSVSGTAAIVVSSQDFSVSKADLIRELKRNFAPVTDTSAAWEKFYSATQSHKETIIDWRTRVQLLHKATGGTDPAALKSKLFCGLNDQRLKDLISWKFEDSNSTEADLFELIRKTTERSKSGRVSTITTGSTAQLEKQVEELTRKVACLTAEKQQPDSDDDRVMNKKKQGSQVYQGIRRDSGSERFDRRNQSHNRPQYYDRRRNYGDTRGSSYNFGRDGFDDRRPYYSMDREQVRPYRNYNEDYRRPYNNNNEEYRRPYSNNNGNYRRPYNNNNGDYRHPYNHDDRRTFNDSDDRRPGNSYNSVSAPSRSSQDTRHPPTQSRKRENWIPHGKPSN